MKTTTGLIRLDPDKLAGFPRRFEKNTKPSSILNLGDHLFAERVPTNKHDPNAIRLYDKARRFVGFVAKN